MEILVKSKPPAKLGILSYKTSEDYASVREHH